MTLYMSLKYFTRRCTVVHQSNMITNTPKYSKHTCQCIDLDRNKSVNYSSKCQLLVQYFMTIFLMYFMTILPHILILVLPVFHDNIHNCLAFTCAVFHAIHFNLHTSTIIRHMIMHMQCSNCNDLSYIYIYEV